MGNSSSSSSENDSGSSSSDSSDKEDKKRTSVRRRKSSAASIRREEVFWDDEDIEKCFPTPEQLKEDGRAGWVETFGIHAELFLTEIADDFAETNEDALLTEKAEKTSFKIKQFKGNVNRFATQTKGVSDAFQGLLDLLHWKHPLQTLSFACMYFYVCWTEYLISTILFFFILQLAINYVSEFKGIRLGLRFLPIPCARDAPKFVREIKEQKRKKKFAEKLNQGACRGQVIAETIHKCCAKINQFLKWEKRFFTGLCFFSLVLIFHISIFVSTSFFAHALMIGAGVYFFFIEYLLFRFPKLRSLMLGKAKKNRYLTKHELITSWKRSSHARLSPAPKK